MKFDDILEIIEADGKILDFRFSKSQIPMYLPIRFILLQSLINKEFNLSNPHVKAARQSIKEIFHYIYHTLKYNLFFAPRKDIYIFSSGIVNISEQGRYTNRLYDHFYTLMRDKTQIIESSVKQSYLVPKKEKIYFRDIIDIIIVLISKCIPIKTQDDKTIRKFIHYLKKNSGVDISDQIYHEIETALRKASKKMDVATIMYTWFFKYKKPKIIIIEDGQYGGYSYIFKVAKKLGILTAEYQHGYIGLSHPAYNYNVNIFDQIKEYLPDYLLTHGDYWSERVRVPAKKITIGFPNLTEKSTQISSYYIPQRKILFISGGTTYKQLYLLIDDLIDDLQALGLQIILRPHPSEKPAITERYGELMKRNVHIDTQNLYDSLQSCEIIVGMEVSTVLFEATYFTKKVHLMKTLYTCFYEPLSIFVDFENANELLINIRDNVEIKFEPNYFWEKDWRKNYSTFIQSVQGK